MGAYVTFLKRLAGSNTFAVFCILFTMVLFGLSFLFSRIALESASAFTLLSWRFFTAFFIMTALRAAGLLKIDLKRPPVSLLCMGLVYPVSYFFLETIGLGLTSVAESGIILSMVPVVSMVIAALFLREYPVRLQVLSIIFSVLGTVVVVLGQDISSPSFNLPGYFALFGAVVSAALFFTLSRSAGGYSSAAKSYVMLGMGFIAFTAFAAVEHIRNGTVSEWLALPFQNMNFLASILYLGALASVVGSWSMNFSVERLGVHRTSVFAAVATVVGVLAGILFLRESLTAAQAAGMVMILLGVTGVNKFGRKA